MSNTISAEIRAFLDSNNVMTLRDSSKDLYRYALDSFIDYCGPWKASNITAANLADFCASLLHKKKSISTIKQYLTIVKMYLKWAGNPVQYSFKAPAGSKKKQQMKQIERWFTEDEVEKIMNYEFQNGTALRNKIMVRILFETGARIQEIACIRWKDVNMMERTIWLRTSKTVPRPAFVSSETNLLLNRYRDQDFNFTGDDDDKEWEKELFPNVSQCKKIFTDMLVDLGLKNGADGRGPHTMRHFTATWLYYVGGMKDFDIATLLGDKVEIIRNVYLHPTPKMLKARVDKAMGW